MPVTGRALSGLGVASLVWPRVLQGAVALWLWLAVAAGLGLGLGLGAQPALAQETPASAGDAVTIDYEAWDALARRAESAIEAGRASNDAFETLRADVAAARDRFLRGQDVNGARIETLRSQIAALGPAPEDGAVEDADIATRRAALQEQLAQAQAPVLRAVEAFNRADGIVGEIDAIIRDRQTDELLELGPSPLLPGNWLTALVELERATRLIMGETAEAWSSDGRRATMRDTLPVIVLLAIFSLVLVLRGRAIIVAIRRAIQDQLPKKAHRTARVLLSVLEMALPVVGLYIGAAAIEATGMLGLRGTALLWALPTVGLFLIGAQWLGRQLFGTEHYISLPVAKRNALRRSGSFLGLLYGLSAILAALTRFDSLSPSTVAVLYFPFAVLAGLALVRLGQVLIRATRPDPEAETQVYGTRWMNYAGRLTILFAVVGMILVGVGYLQAGLFLLLPTIGTLALLGFLFVIDDLMREIYCLVVGAEDENPRMALIPTLMSLALALCALPFFALIWGARTADLLELWSSFREGFTVGEARISPEAFLTFVLIFAVLYVATRMIQGALRSNVLPKTTIDKGGQTAIVSGVGYIGIFLAAVIAITTAGIDLSSIALVAGALSVGIGFGLQNIVQNFVSGIILLIERPVAEGDWVQVGGTTGIVKKISVRSTLIETFDKVDVIVPNGDFIASAVQNWTRTNNIGRVIVTVGVAYGTDTRRVNDILNEIAQEHPLVVVDPAPGVDFLGFGADSLDFRIRAVLSDVNFSLSVKNEIHHRIAERFAEEGIEIPFAQRDIWLRNPEALRGPPPPHRGPQAVDQIDDSSRGDILADPQPGELTPEQIGEGGETT